MGLFLRGPPFGLAVSQVLALKSKAIQDGELHNRPDP